MTSTRVCGLLCLGCLGLLAPTEARATEPASTEVTGQEPVTLPEPGHEDAEAHHAAAPDDEPEGLGFGGVPAINYNSDEGFGYGVIGNLYWYERGLQPYKYSLMLQIYLTTRWVHAHKIRVDAVDMFGLPLRLWGEIGYYSTITQNFCGVGDQVTCDPADAEAQATELNLEGVPRDYLVKHYYQMRYIQPYGYLNGRWKLTDLPRKIEIMAGWRGYLYIPGEIGKPGTYPNSLFAEYAEDGEAGFASVLQAGAMLDTRDNEPAPTRGTWIEGTLRGSTFLWGSSWNYVGANLTLRGYVPLNASRRAILAGRLVLDGIVGDAPVLEMSRMGGSTDYQAFGGEFMGRGLRLQRLLGKVKAMGQVELRWTFVSFELFEQDFDVGTLAYLDAGMVAFDWDVLLERLPATHLGFGSGLRLTWNKNFIIRADVAISPMEANAPGIYVNLGHVF